jgi:hypothetical protein
VGAPRAACAGPVGAMTARDDYQVLALVEARWSDGDRTPRAVRELTFILDEVDRLRAIRDLVVRDN